MVERASQISFRPETGLAGRATFQYLLPAGDSISWLSELPRYVSGRRQAYWIAPDFKICFQPERALVGRATFQDHFPAGDRSSPWREISIFASSRRQHWLVQPFKICVLLETGLVGVIFHNLLPAGDIITLYRNFEGSVSGWRHAWWVARHFTICFQPET